jgi:hypothetical protein
VDNDRNMDLQTASGFLGDRYGPAVEDLAELGGGDWSRAYSFRLGERDLVARFGRHPEDFETDRKAMAFNSPALPVPRVLEIGVWDTPGLYYAISERRVGRCLEELDSAGWRAVMPALLRGLDALRKAPVPGTGVDWACADSDASRSWTEWLVQSLEDPPGGGSTAGARSWQTSPRSRTFSAPVEKPW